MENTTVHQELDTNLKKLNALQENPTATKKEFNEVIARINQLEKELDKKVA